MSRKFALVLVALLVAVPLFAAGISSTAPGHKTDNSAVAPASQAPYHRAAPKAWMTLHTQDFETAMAPWTHTNGQAFPNGWDRQNSALHSTWTPPAAGSWSLWIDSDAAGSGASQADTAMSPAVATPSMDTIKFVWGHSFNYYSAADLYQVLHRTFSSGAWSAWIVDRSYTADLNPVWDSVTITDEVDSIQLGFYYQGAYGWYTAVDNVTITGFQSILAHDVKTQSIDVPATAIVPPGVAFLATMSVKNAGTNPESDFGNNYVIYDSTGTQVYGVSLPIVTPDSLQPDSVRQLAISNFTPDSMMRYQVVAWPSLAGDERHSNDTMRFNFRTFDRDMGATAIVTPAGNFTPADDVDPQATFHNYATEAADFDAHFQIYDGTASLVYDQTVAIAGLAAGADTTITFPTWAAPHAAGTYSMMAYTVMTFDLDAGNDTATGSYNCAFMGWTALDPTGSNAIQWPGFCTDGSLMYIVGGISSSTLYNYVQVYDPVAGTWSQPTTMPTAAWRPNCAVIDGKLYVIGGMDAAFAPVAQTQIYDIAGNSWSTGTVAPSPRGGCGGGVVGGRMYIVGGATSSSFPTDCPTWEYNPEADTAGGSPWTQLTDCPRGASGMILGAGFYGAPGLNRVVVGGDYRGYTNSLNTFYTYDPAGDAWTTLAAAPNAVGGKDPGMVWDDSHIYLWGGDPAGGWSSYVNATYTYDEVGGAWSDLGILTNASVEGWAGALIGQKIFAFSGTTGSGAITPAPFEWTWDLTYAGVAGKPSAVAAPGTFALHGNYPNPVHDNTTIRFQLPKAGRVNLAVYSITGQLVKTIASGEMTAGRHSAGWNGRDNAGRAVSSGVYFYRLSAAGANATGKLVVVR